MPHTGGSNYKVKWLAAVGESGTAKQRALERNKQRDVSVGASMSATEALHKTGNVVREAAAQARDVILALDEYKDVGQLHFNEMKDQIDMKLSNMDLVTMARRIRDVLKLAEMRIGILSEACDDQAQALLAIEEKDKQVNAHTSLLNEAYMANAGVGINPSESEIEAYISRHNAGYARYGTPYHDLEEDWDERVFRGKLLGKAQTSEGEESDSDESEILPITPKTTPKKEVSGTVQKFAKPASSARVNRVNGTPTDSLDV